MQAIQIGCVWGRRMPPPHTTNNILVQLKYILG